MTEQEAVETLVILKGTGAIIGEEIEAIDIVDDAMLELEEIQQYRAIGTVEELQKAEKEEDILKFYYCDSEDSYLVGLRIDNFYYAHYIDGRWVFDMSRHLPWGKHVVDDTTAWKEYTYPSEPREINFSEWLNGFIKKECGGTPEECREAVEKQIPKKITHPGCFDNEGVWHTWNGIDGVPYDLCPNCETNLCTDGVFCRDKKRMKYCENCGQKLDFGE